MNQDAVVREYCASDAQAVKACIVELQDYERTIDPRLRPGASMAAEYLAQTLDRCRDFTGRVFILDCDGAVAGFITVLARMPFHELDDPPGEFALISDLVVREPFRRRGYGRALLDAAERFARHSGASELRLGVLSANRTALEVYRRAGFESHSHVLSKRLGAQLD
jgi:ribosomal protein S18 acetylase RimI-like enzyme